MTFNTKNDESKMHSDLFFLKKSGNEKNTVNRIGAKIKRPTPGANSNPNVADNMGKTLGLLHKTSPVISPPRTSDDVSVRSSGMIYRKGLSYDLKSLCAK
jgi:hypothetical protein